MAPMSRTGLCSMESGGIRFLVSQSFIENLLIMEFINFYIVVFSALITLFSIIIAYIAHVFNWKPLCARESRNFERRAEFPHINPCSLRQRQQLFILPILRIIMADFYNQTNYSYPFYPWYIPPPEIEPLCPYINIQNHSNLEAEYKEKIKTLEEKIAKLTKQKKQLQSQLRPKRKYSKRNMNLPKIYTCEHKQCSKRYSSKIALQCHQKKKHSQEHQ